jgi:hypothetical protein
LLNPKWLISVREVLSNQLNFAKTFESINRTGNELHHDYLKMEARLHIAKEAGESVFLMVYYRGEGGVDQRCLDTYALVKDNTYFALEHYIRELA